MRRAVLVLILLAVPCLAAPVAHGWSEPPEDDGARLARWLPLARAAWPGSPCAGREVVHLRADADLAAEAPSLAPNAVAPLQGMAAPSSCEAWIAAGLSPLRFCTVLVHEVGHLAGRDHTAGAGDVMNGAGDIGHEPCERAVRPPLTVLIDQELRALLPAPRAAWRIGCGPRREGERRCVARRGERVRRFWVSGTRSSVTVVPA
jgi:hypothetical protein